MKIKFVPILILTLVLSVALTACQSNSNTDSDTSSGQSVSEFKTLGDVFSADTNGFMATYDSESYIAAFEYDGKWVRVSADIPDGLYDQVLEEQTKPNEYNVEEKVFADVPITESKVIGTSEEVQADVEQYIGKTGSELEAGGFQIGPLAVNGDMTDCTASKGDFDYLVTFKGAVADPDTEDTSSAIKDLTIEEVVIQGVSLNGFEF